MKKYIILMFLLSISKAYSLSDNQNTETPETVVPFTEEEKIIIRRIMNFWVDSTDKYLLMFGCGVSPFKSTESYDSKASPECKQVLEFFKKEQETTLRFNQEKEEMFENICHAIDMCRFIIAKNIT